MQMGSWGPLRAWKILEFELPRPFNTAILAAKTSLKSLKIIYNTCETEKMPLLKLIYIEWKTGYTERSMHNWTHSVDWVIGNYHLLVIFILGIFEPSILRLLSKLRENAKNLNGRLYCFQSVLEPSYPHRVLAQVVVLSFQVQRETTIYT